MDFANKKMQDGLNDLLRGEPLYFYLIDEFTGEPVKDTSSDPVYPIEIKTTGDLVKKAVPFLKVGFQALKLFNSVSEIANLVGYPTPKLETSTMNSLNSSLDLLSSESSVSAFTVIQSNVSEVHNNGNESSAKQYVRGPDLRELERFFAENDRNSTFAGMIRCCGIDGSACWTTEKGKEKLEKYLKEVSSSAAVSAVSVTGSVLAADTRERISSSPQQSAHLSTSVELTVPANNNNTQSKYKKAWEILKNPSYQLDGIKLQELMDEYGFCDEEDLLDISEDHLTNLSIYLKLSVRTKIVKLLLTQPNKVDLKLNTIITLIIYFLKSTIQFKEFSSRRTARSTIQFDVLG
jgi:hypothetical protein